MLNTIENTILKVLREKFPNFEVDSFPVDFALYTFTSPDGCILLRYENSSMSNQNTVWSVMSDETYNLTIFAAVRYAQKHSDVYPFLRKLKTLLNGLQILNKRVSLNKVNFEDEINGDLWYSYDIKITLPLTDEYKDESEAALDVLFEKSSYSG